MDIVHDHVWETDDVVVCITVVVYGWNRDACVVPGKRSEYSSVRCAIYGFGRGVLISRPEGTIASKRYTSHDLK